MPYGSFCVSSHQRPFRSLEGNILFYNDLISFILNDYTLCGLCRAALKQWDGDTIYGLKNMFFFHKFLSQFPPLHLFKKKKIKHLCHYRCTIISLLYSYHLFFDYNYVSIIKISDPYIITQLLLQKPILCYQATLSR